MTRYRIYYADGTIFTDGDARKFEKYGVICILQKRLDDVHYHMVSGTPYYLFTDDEWIPAWENDLADYLINMPDKIQGCIMGRLVSKKQFNEVYEQAKKDRAKEILHND